MFKNADNVRKILDKVPDNRLLLETDSPLLVPPMERKNGSNYSEPYMVADVANYIAKRRDVSTVRLWEIVEKNFTKLLNM
jgi:TatD DNase family protein